MIYLLHQKKGEVRECNIAAVTGYSKASVCNMVKTLCHLEHILSDETIRALQNQLIEKGAAENGKTTCLFMDKRL